MVACVILRHAKFRNPVCQNGGPEWENILGRGGYRFESNTIVLAADEIVPHLREHRTTVYGIMEREKEVILKLV